MSLHDLFKYQKHHFAQEKFLTRGKILLQKEMMNVKILFLEAIWIVIPSVYWDRISCAVPRNQERAWFKS